MDLSTPGLEQWTMQSALDGHPEIVVQSAPGTDIVCSVICQSLTLSAADADALIVALDQGEADEGEVQVSTTEQDPMVLNVWNASGEHLNLHTLDMEGFKEKLRHAITTARS